MIYFDKRLDDQIAALRQEPTYAFFSTTILEIGGCFKFCYPAWDAGYRTTKQSNSLAWWLCNVHWQSLDRGATVPQHCDNHQGVWGGSVRLIWLISPLKWPPRPCCVAILEDLVDRVRHEEPLKWPPRPNLSTETLSWGAESIGVTTKIHNAFYPMQDTLPRIYTIPKMRSHYHEYTQSCITTNIHNHVLPRIYATMYYRGIL